MKSTCYLRIGKTKRGTLKFSAGTKPNSAPIASARYSDPPLPTVLVKLNLDLPADVFGPDAEVDVLVEAGIAEVLVEVDDAA